VFYAKGFREESMKTAFKEWAAVCRALATGTQILILRKGGIVEPGGVFRVEHPEFLLFPTFLHQSPESLVPAAQHLLDDVQAEAPPAGTIVFRHVARVTDHFRIESAEGLPRLRAFHVWSNAVVEERFHRWQKSLHVLVVRVYALTGAVSIPTRDSYAGCKSWVELEEDVDIAGAVPVISDVEFNRRADEIRSSVRGST
jgi:hypothetical protein